MTASHMVIYWWLSAYPGEMEQFEDHLSTRGCLTSLRNKPQQKEPVNVYSYCVMVKTVSNYCVCGSPLLSNSVTFSYSLQLSL